MLSVIRKNLSRRRVFAALFIICFPFIDWAQPAGPESETCTDCHDGIVTNCGLTCRACHALAEAVDQPAENHVKIIPNPSKEAYWAQLCQKCHAEQVAQLRQDKHYSLSGMINRTRYLWGKDSALTNAYPPESWKKLKSVETTGKTPANLVDRLLAQKCLACHFEADGRQAAIGRKRRGGCAACHSPLNQRTGTPLNGHKFTRKVQSTTCLTCHSPNYVGGDYFGYFEHDYHNEYNTPFGSEPRFGAYQHRLAADVHQQSGMQCMDCHKQHGSFSQVDARVSDCRDCHGGFNQKPVIAGDTIPFNGSHVAHQSFHRDISCSACHARWSYQDYGLHLFLDESDNYEMWKNFIWQGDQIITDLLQKQLGLAADKRIKARTPNRLTGKMMAGAWFKGWTFRRWENPILGLDKSGMYRNIRPMYQYYITYVDSLEQIWLDSKIPETSDGKTGWVWDIYTPHTTGKTGRDCESCHLNAKAVGLGIRNHPGDSVAHPITIPNRVIESEGRILNPDEQQQLLNKSKDYKKWRAKDFREKGIESFFEE